MLFAPEYHKTDYYVRYRENILSPKENCQKEEDKP